MVALSPLAGAGWQFFTSDGVPLSGGKLYTYAAGTTTPLAAYTSVSGGTAHANPIVLDSAGRVSSEVWLTSTATYKFTLTTSTDVSIWTKDNISGISAAADLAASSGSSLVGFLQSGASAVARTAQAKMREEISVADFATFANYLAAIPTGFFTQDGGDIHRFGRVMAGAAQQSDLRFPNVEKDWLTVFQQANGVSQGTILAAQIAGITQTQTGSGSAVGGLFASQSLPFTSAGTSCIALAAIAANNNTTLATQAWGFYVEAHRTNAATQQSIGIEIDTRATVAGQTPHPWLQGLTVALQIAAGAQFGAGLFDSDVGIQFAKNPDKFKVGINFLHDSLTGAAGGTGNAAAITMAPGHEIRWLNSAGAQQAQIACTTNLTNGPRLSFDASALRIYSQAGVVGTEFILTASAANYLSLANNTAGTPPYVAALGADTNIDLQLTPKGAGLLRFGAFTSNADTAVTGYITIKDAGGTTRKLATIA